MDDQPRGAATGHPDTRFPSSAPHRSASPKTTSRPSAIGHRTRAHRIAAPRWRDRDTPRVLVAAAGWSWRLLLVGVVAYLVVRLLALLWLVVVPVLAALLLSALVHPVTTLVRRHMSGPAAAGVTLMLTVVLLGGLGYGVGLRFVDQLPTLSDEVVATIGRFRTQLRGLGVGQAQLDQLQDVATGWIQEHRTDLLSYLTTGAGYLLEFLTMAVLTLFVAFFLLYDGERVWRWLLGPIPPATAPRVDRTGRAAWATLTAYVHGTAVIATFHGLVIGLVLSVLGVPLVVPLAVLVFIGGFVPLAGALVAGGLAVLVALGTRGWATALVLLGVLLVENQVEAHLLQPFVMGRYVRLHPLAIGLAIAVGTVLGGIPGAIVAVPVAAIVYRAAPLLTGRRRTPRTDARPRRRSRAAAANR